MKKYSLTDFAKKVNEKMKKVLSAYTPEVSLSLGPATIAVRAVPNTKKLAEAILTDEEER